MQKGQALILILVGILIIAAVGGVYYLRRSTVTTPWMNDVKSFIDHEESLKERLKDAIPTSSSVPDETANWKTYTNNNLEFSFKYPDNYFKYQQESSGVGIYLAPSQGEGGNGPKFLKSGDVWLNATTLSGANLKSIDEYLSLQGQGNFYANAQKTPTVISGVSGYKVSYSYAAVAGNVTIYNYEGIVLRNGIIYAITLSAWSQDTLKLNQPMLDQILSTFKFL